MAQHAGGEQEVQASGCGFRDRSGRYAV